MSNYKDLTKDECVDLLLSIENPIIVMHARPDGDTAGSAMALHTVFEMLGKKASVACSDPIPERLEFIFEGVGLSDIEPGMTPVAIDVASPSQLGSLRKEIEGRTALMIDHHEKGEKFAPCYKKGGLSSAAEVLFEIVEELISRGLISMTSTLAMHLYTAISSDTGCFCYSSADATTHKRVAKLIETGFDFAKINHLLFHSKSIETIKAESFVGSSLKVVADGKVAYASISKDERKMLGLKLEFFDSAVDVVRSLMGVEIAIFVKETDEGTLRASLRSTKHNVASIAERHRGGGHILAAGCSPLAENACKAAEMLAKEAANLIM